MWSERWSSMNDCSLPANSWLSRSAGAPSRTHCFNCSLVTWLPPASRQRIQLCCIMCTSQLLWLVRWYAVNQLKNPAACVPALCSCSQNDATQQLQQRAAQHLAATAGKQCIALFNFIDGHICWKFQEMPLWHHACMITKENQGFADTNIEQTAAAFRSWLGATDESAADGGRRVVLAAGTQVAVPRLVNSS
jgi:hypothetical protein